MSIVIIRAFVRLREILATHKDLARRIEEPERRQEIQAAHIAAVYNLVKKVMIPRRARRRPIGFVTEG